VQGLDSDWAAIGQRLGSDWTAIGQRLGSDWAAIGQRLGSDWAAIGQPLLKKCLRSDLESISFAIAERLHGDCVAIAQRLNRTKTGRDRKLSMLSDLREIKTESFQILNICPLKLSESWDG
jgi:hypothetical protein